MLTTALGGCPVQIVCTQRRTLRASASREATLSGRKRCRPVARDDVPHGLRGSLTHSIRHWPASACIPAPVLISAAHSDYTVKVIQSGQVSQHKLSLQALSAWTVRSPPRCRLVVGSSWVARPRVPIVVDVWEQEAATGLLTSLMWELECLLHEYLSYNWDRIDDLLQANEDALR